MVIGRSNGSRDGPTIGSSSVVHVHKISMRFRRARTALSGEFDWWTRIFAYLGLQVTYGLCGGACSALLRGQRWVVDKSSNDI
jgi:hypothetical protein